MLGKCDARTLNLWCYIYRYIKKTKIKKVVVEEDEEEEEKSQPSQLE